MPVLFAGLLGAHGGLGPAEMPAKALWMSKNNFRKATVLGVPLNPPAFHPFNPLLALRVSSLPDDAATRAAITTALMDAVWVRSLHVSEPEVVKRVCDAAGFDGAALVATAAEPAAKARLRRQTDEAIAAGVFGVPSMQVGDEVFWGYDDFPYLELLLAGKGPARGRGAGPVADAEAVGDARAAPPASGEVRRRRDTPHSRGRRPAALDELRACGGSTKMKLGVLVFPQPGCSAQLAQMVEALGFDSIVFADTQNITPEVWGQLMLAARDTERIELGTGVTNPGTRDAAVTASAALALQVESAGRAICGIGRGDSSLGKIGRKPTRSPSSSVMSRSCRAICAARRWIARARRAGSSGTPTPGCRRCRSR